MEQTILKGSDLEEKLDMKLLQEKCRGVFLVCGNSLQYLHWGVYFQSLKERMGIHVVRFGDFEVNPSYDSVTNGLQAFRDSGCDLIIAAGGGSAIDVAKCIRLYSDPQIPFYVIPTTAGSGSEATQFAVIYRDGKKESISDPAIVPSVVIHDPAVLKTLPVRQKAATMLDAICHSIESLWALQGTDESGQYAQEALKILWKHSKSYLQEDETVYEKVQQASYLAGRAINISKTTAGHAMCYKLTTMYNLPHGMAAALCMNELWRIMPDPSLECIDPRGRAYLNGNLMRIASCMGFDNPMDAQRAFEDHLRKWIEDWPKTVSEGDLDILKESVNAERLGNHPVRLEKDLIRSLYRNILLGEQEK